MKKLVTAVAFATLIASPAFAQSYNPSVGSGNIARAPGTQRHVGVQYPSRVLGAFAQAAPAQNFLQNGVSSNTVVADGRIIGHDPDPNVRLMLQRDYYSRQGF